MEEKISASTAAVDTGAQVKRIEEWHGQEKYSQQAMGKRKILIIVPLRPLKSFKYALLLFLVYEIIKS